jgi:hypothetical protein
MVATLEIAAESGDGGGIGLHIFLVLSVLGIVLLGWILLRGYRDGDQ